MTDRYNPTRSQSGSDLLPIQQGFELQANELKRGYQNTGDSLCLHLLGTLAMGAGKLLQARMYFLAERQHLQTGEHSRLAANAFEMGRLAQLRAEPYQAMLYVRASLRYARLARNTVQEQRARQLLNQLMLLLGEGPHDRQIFSQSA